MDKDIVDYLRLIFYTLCIIVGLLVALNVKAMRISNEVLTKTEKMPDNERRVLPKNEDKAGRKMMMRVSAYSSVEGCDDKECIMANGRKAYVGAVACPRSWKLGTVVKIEGKKYVCGDRLSMKYDSRVDLFTGYGKEGYKRARQWGVRSLEVEIIN